MSSGSIAHAKRFERYRRVLSKAKCNRLSLAKISLELVVALLPAKKQKSLKKI